MATVKKPLSILAAQFKTTNFPALVANQGTNFPVVGLAFDASTDEAAFFFFKASSYGSGNLSFILDWYADTASSGNVVWEAQLAAITPDTDSQDVETDGLATLNFVQDTHLGTTGQRVHRCTITISNLDSLAADDVLFVRLARDANGTNATDDLTGDAVLIGAELQYSDS